MSIKQKLISLDDFYNSVTIDKVLLNDHSIYNDRSSRQVFDSLMSEYEGDTINILPKCKCGHLHGEYYEGVRCTRCGTVAHSLQYDPVVWAKAFTPELKFINPMFFFMLNALLDGDIQYLTGLTDTPRTKSNISISINKNVLHDNRTYRNFLASLRDILVYLTTLGSYQRGYKGKRLQEILEMWDTQKQVVLSDYLPMINNMLFAVTKTTKGKFVDTGLADVMDIATTWMRRANDLSADIEDYDKTTAKAVCMLGRMPEFYVKTYLSKKTGIFRKHVYSARSPFTFRCVIVSCPGKHNYDELEVPWTTLVSVFRPHVLNKLMKTGKYSYKEASNKIYKAVKKYDPEIAAIGEELIAEGKSRNGKGIATLSHRNPSLLASSSQLTYIVKFNKEPDIRTVAFSQLICKGPNADFDGRKI